MLNIVDWNVSVIIPNAMNIKLQYKRAGLSNTLCISDLEWTTLFGGDRQEESINGIVALLRHSIGLYKRIETQ